MWILYALIAAISAALVAIFGKLGLKNIDPTLATALRGIVMVILLIIAVIALKKFDIHSLQQLSQKEWVYLILAGIAGAISWAAYFYALQKGPASAVAAIDRTSIVFVVLFSLLFLAEALSWKSILGTILITGGALLFVL